MIMRRAALLAAGLILAGCSTVVDGTGQTASGVRTTDVPAPCSSTTTNRAPGCTPSPSPTTATTSSSATLTPTPTPSPTTSSASPANALPAAWASFARTVYRTPLGDPAVLNDCKIADSTSLARFKLTLAAPDSTLGASCSLDFRGPKVKEQQSVVISVLRSGPDRTPTPKRTTVSGQTVYAFPYERGGACVRELVVSGGGVTTTASVRIYGVLPGGRATACGVSDALIAPFAAIAAGKVTAPTIPMATPSLFALDACKVAAAARISSSALAAGSSASGTDYDTSCSWSGRAVLFLSTGLMRNPSAQPRGKTVTVGTHTLHNTANVKGTCNYTSKQAGGETVEVYFSQSKAATAAQCRSAAALLGRYLDTLRLR